MVDGSAKQRAALQATCELAGELFHTSDGSLFGHVFPQHVKVFEQHCAFVFKRRFKWPAAANRVFDLPKDPWIRHGAAAD